MKRRGKERKERERKKLFVVIYTQIKSIQNKTKINNQMNTNRNKQKRMNVLKQSEEKRRNQRGKERERQCR